MSTSQQSPDPLDLIDGSPVEIRGHKPAINSAFHLSGSPDSLNIASSPPSSPIAAALWRREQQPAQNQRGRNSRAREQTVGRQATSSADSSPTSSPTSSPLPQLWLMSAHTSPFKKLKIPLSEDLPVPYDLYAAHLRSLNNPYNEDVHYGLWQLVLQHALFGCESAKRDIAQNKSQNPHLCFIVYPQLAVKEMEGDEDRDDEAFDKFRSKLSFQGQLNEVETNRLRKVLSRRIPDFTGILALLDYCDEDGFRVLVGLRSRKIVVIEVKPYPESDGTTPMEQLVDQALSNTIDSEQVHTQVSHAFSEDPAVDYIGAIAACGWSWTYFGYTRENMTHSLAQQFYVEQPGSDATPLVEGPSTHDKRRGELDYTPPKFPPPLPSLLPLHPDNLPKPVTPQAGCSTSLGTDAGNKRKRSSYDNGQINVKKERLEEEAEDVPQDTRLPDPELQRLVPGQARPFYDILDANGALDSAFGALYELLKQHNDDFWPQAPSELQ